MTDLPASSKKIAIIGAGFTGVALAAALHRYAKEPITIDLFEKTGEFGAGDAYRTPYSWHLLNARAGDMSALEDDPEHFVRWIHSHAATYLDPASPPARQFMPRVLYHQYLCSLMANIFQDEEQRCRLNLIPAEVVDLVSGANGVTLTTSDQETFHADHAVFAHGNNPPSPLPFDLPSAMQCIDNPWDYAALQSVPADDPVLIVGTGLSMIDAVLTLHHQQHRGKIYAISRRGLLPLPHSDDNQHHEFDVEQLPRDMRGMVKMIRAEADKLLTSGGDWRAIMHHMRRHLEGLWQRTNVRCQERFLRHVLPYWNIHRHRVHEKLSRLLDDLQQQGQLQVMAGRLLSVNDNGVEVRLRHEVGKTSLQVKHIINCIGSSNQIQPDRQVLLHNLIKRGNISQDPLQLGLRTTDQFQLKTAKGELLPSCYTLGPPVRGERWECIAVPEIRKQCKALAMHLL